MAYDLLLKGGEVVDPGRSFRGKADVAIQKGKIVAVQPDIAETEAVRVQDVSGKLVCPGLIDLHAHVFVNASDMGNETDQRCAASGVTTIIDAGSAGSATFAGLRQSVADRSQVRLRCFRASVGSGADSSSGRRTDAYGLRRPRRLCPHN